MYLCITGLLTGYMTLVYSGYLKICWQIFIIYLMFKCNNEKRPSNKRISKPFMRSNDDQLANKMLTWINVLPFRIHKLVLSLRLLIKFTFLLILPEITPFYVLYLQTNKSYSARLVLWQEPPRCLSFTLDYIMDVLVSSMYPRSNQTFATKLKFWRDISVITKLQGDFCHYILTRTLNFLGNRSLTRTLTLFYYFDGIVVMITSGKTQKRREPDQLPFPLRLKLPVYVRKAIVLSNTTTWF